MARRLRMKVRRALVAVTPPIVAAGIRWTLIRLARRPSPEAQPAPTPPVAAAPEPFTEDAISRVRPPESESEPPPADIPRIEVEPTQSEPALLEWEYVPEGFARVLDGWDGGSVGEAYAEKWPEWVEALRAPAPLGIYHESVSGVPLAREDLGAHNMLLSFAYVLARAAYGRERLHVLDWGGGLGHYEPLARSVMPEVELDWHCREVPGVVRAGERVNPDVTFHTGDDCLQRTYDLVLVSGSLQYEVEWQSRVGRLAAATTGYLLVTRLPIALHVPSFVILQRAYAYGYATEYAGWVISREELLAIADDSGLRLERELLLDATLAGIGAPEEPILHRGFLFRPKAPSDR